LNKLAVSEQFTLKFDERRGTHVVDFEKLIPYLINLIEDYKKENLDFLLIESHFSDMTPENYIDYVIILRCNPDELYKRLEKKGFKKEKIIENVQSEILGSCANFFIEKKIKLPLYEIDTTSITIESIVNIIIDIISNNISAEKYLIGKIDWLEVLAQEDRIDEFFD
jgi:adenylate kinase